MNNNNHNNNNNLYLFIITYYNKVCLFGNLDTNSCGFADGVNCKKLIIKFFIEIYLILILILKNKNKIN